MKKILIPISALLVAGLAHAQVSITENYVHTKTYLDYNGTTPSKTAETVQYFDGLGRPKQVVDVKASPLGRDVVTPIEYDGFGRQVKDYLPIPQGNTLNGAIVPTPLGNSSTIYGGEKIYAEKVLENSPLDRIQQQIQVGNDWSTKPVKFDYDANTTADYVRKYETSTTWVEGRTQTTVQLLQYFLPNQLYKNTVTDEDGNKTIEFKNGKGQTLLVRKALNSTENADTYYVYNEYDQLAFVIPPLASSPTLEPSTMENLYYQYRYDGRNRLVEKKLPGKGWEFMVYDKQDRLVLTQDANLREKNQWLFTKYDQFSRPVYTGISYSGSGRAQHVEAVESFGSANESRTSSSWNNSGMDVYYTKSGAYPNESNITILTVNYYDTYPSYGFNPSFPTTILDQPVLTGTADAEGLSTKSLPVMSLVKNIEDDNWTKNYTYYDTRGRAVGSYSINHLGGRTQVFSKLDFSGTVQQSITRHKRLDTDTDKVITENFTYDHQNRLLTHTHQVDSNPVEYLAQNDYNELSQLRNKKVGGTNAGSPLQSIDYAYNIRGWMTKINDPLNLNGKLFGYEIKYNNPVDNNIGTGRFNGNIGEIDWKSSTDGILKRYNYLYDGLNRLLKGEYSEPQSSLINNHYFDEELTYDLNGNIKTLKRFSKPSSGTIAEKIDDLIYNYKYFNLSNQLEKVSLPSNVINNSSGYDAIGNTINYDTNGNMIDYKDKGRAFISYNILNLPNNFDGEGFDYQKYVYRADGTKVQRIFWLVFGNKTTITDYLDGFQYQNTIAKFVPFSEGYYDFEKNLYIYHYNDHLGNMRLSFVRENNITKVIDDNDYYPFGMLHKKEYYNSQNPLYSYEFNGKENQGFGIYDFGARMYMADLGKWGVVDPLAEKYPSWSPYVYTFNNPIRFTDPDGRAPNDIVYFNMQGQEVYRIKSNTEFKTYVQASTFSELIGSNTSIAPFGSGISGYFVQAQMPNIIQTRTQSGEDVSGSKYQANDYQIAASTHLANNELNSGSMIVGDKNGNIIPQGALKDVPDISVNLVKAWSMQESHSGTNGSILQVNNNGDFTPDKTSIGITKGATFSTNQEVNLAIRYAIGKGFTSSPNYSKDGSGKIISRNWSWHGWNAAIKGYNGGGVQGYEKYIQTMVNESQKPKPSNY